jgi:alpha-glucosidase
MFKVQQLLSATTLYRSGTPFHTHSTVTQIDQSRFESCSEVTHFTCAETDGGVTLELRLDAADSVYGLGQTTGPVNRRGGRYRSYSKQAVPHTPGTAALNGAHPFFLLDGARRLGVFLDYPSSASFDIGFTDPDRLTITIPSVDFDLYVIEGDTTQSIIREFLTLVGTPYLPPKWGFGYHQCRFSYMDSDEVREVITGFETLDIPLDALYLDIDYMDDYRVFTADPQRFGDLPELVAELREKGIEVVPILDPGVQIREGYSVYEEGKRSNLFCIDREGNDFVGTVWPGPVHLPDFMNARCRTWWGTLHRRFTEIGIRGFWNDMNEPELFFTGRGIDRLRHAVASARTHEFRGTDAIDFVREVSRFWNTEDDYADLFHRGESGEVLAHEQVHNLYGFFMARATAEGLQALMPDTRYFLLSRSSTIGLHRIGAIWTGDNSSWWEHLQDHMRLMISLNLCGFFYCGADVGGHIGDVSAELMVRWMQLGAFSPLFRKSERVAATGAVDVHSVN